MDDLVRIWETPAAKEIRMIAGWQQWADAGNTSSGLPQYLIKQTGARKIGEIAPHGFYVFQVPGTHHFLRPEIKLKEGFREELEERRNDFYYTGDEDKGLVIFLGHEPHLNAEGYADAFFRAVEALGVGRVAAVGGVYGPMPYDRDRQVSCVYSLREMKEELTQYAVRFSDYEGGATIGTFLVDQAEKRGIEFLVFYAFVPAYDFGDLSSGHQGMRIETDYKAWYDLMKRFDHMFDLGIELSDLERQSHDLLVSVDSRIDALEEDMPEAKLREFIEGISSDFSERPFVPLDDVWEQGLRDIFNDTED